MKVYIEGKQIELIDREVKDAKRRIKDLLDLILEKTGDAAPTYYFTCLIRKREPTPGSLFFC